jgi:isopentenyl diphosphate isomerase/L-lactate dehydrogenase-like FMN-dependent dehydrogenase
VYFGGVRSGTDSAKLIALGVKAVVFGATLGIAAGGAIAAGATGITLEFAPDRSEEERAGAIVNIVSASAGEASMMARCTGKTNLHNLEPEDLRSVTIATAEATGVPLTATRPA